MNPIEKIKEKELKKSQILLEAKTIDSEVQSYKDKLQTYGIKNKTVKAINNSFQGVEKQKSDIGKTKALDLLIDTFMPFKIVEYKTLDEVCKDYDLVISSISNYDKAVPDENLEEMDIFIDRLKGMDKNVLKRISVKANNSFTFDNDDFYKFVTETRSEWERSQLISFDKMFKIAAPLNHFDMPKRNIKIGNEYHYIGKKPSFDYKPSFSKPKVQLDPIVFIPIRFIEKIYCIIVTAWDKEADDSRILSKI